MLFRSVDQIERPLLTPDEVMRLRPPAKTGHGTAERIVAPGDMLIFVSGHHPIYGTQILYFTDPILAKRAEIRPPSQFLAIEDGRIIQQRPADRTRNVISAAEPEPQSGTTDSATDATMSPMEEAFWNELGQVAPREVTARAAVATGFVEQLDLDLHEADIRPSIDERS